jgi:hypothetical protein
MTSRISEYESETETINLFFDTQARPARGSRARLERFVGCRCHQKTSSNTPQGSRFILRSLSVPRWPVLQRTLRTQYIWLHNPYAPPRFLSRSFVRPSTLLVPAVPKALLQTMGSPSELSWLLRIAHIYLLTVHWSLRHAGLESRRLLRPLRMPTLTPFINYIHTAVPLCSGHSRNPIVGCKMYIASASQHSYLPTNTSGRDVLANKGEMLHTCDEQQECLGDIAVKPSKVHIMKYMPVMIHNAKCIQLSCLQRHRGSGCLFQLWDGTRYTNNCKLSAHVPVPPAIWQRLE